MDAASIKNNFFKFWNNFTPPQKILLLVLALLLVAGIIKAVYYTWLFGGADLRDRIVGARLLNTMHSPYYYKWSPGDPEEFINPNLIPNRSINGISAAPGTLYILYPISFLKYPLIRVIWLVMQYFFLGSIFFYFFRQKTSSNVKVLLALFGILFFFCSPFWLLHIDRGQVYIMYAYFFLLIYRNLKSRKTGLQFSAGLLITLAIYCRPTFFVLVLPLLLAFNPRVFAGLFLGGCIALFLLFFNFHLWQDYLTSMSMFTKVTAGLQTSVESPIVYPETIEGTTNLRMGKLDFMCGGLAPLDTHLSKIFPSTSGMVFICVYLILVGLLVFLLWKKIRTKDPILFILFGFLFYMLAEYVMPAPRGAYALMQWVVPVLLMLYTERMSIADRILMAIGLCFMVDFPFYFPFLNDIGELLLVYSIVNFIRKYPMVKTNHKTEQLYIA